jgi:ribose/xylose/arabinose/galactoside ABC-type transport system permease subunit
MDPDKVDIVVKWKVPTHTGLLRGFIRSVGYLANNVPGVRLPLGMQSAITGDAVPFHWGHTEQRAVENWYRQPGNIVGGCGITPQMWIRMVVLLKYQVWSTKEQIGRKQT